MHSLSGIRKPWTRCILLQDMSKSRRVELKQKHLSKCFYFCLTDCSGVHGRKPGCTQKPFLIHLQPLVSAGLGVRLFKAVRFNTPPDLDIKHWAYQEPHWYTTSQTRQDLPTGAGPRKSRLAHKS